MTVRRTRALAAVCAPLLACVAAITTLVEPIANLRAQDVSILRVPLPASGMTLARGLSVGTFFDVVGRRSAAFGYEDRALEMWAYPLKVIDGFQLSFALEGYPVPVPVSELGGTIEVRPEATILTASHAAFSVRQILFAPIDEPALVLLLEIDTTLPMTITGSFRPVLRPMWPAGAGSATISWDAVARAYDIAEESGRFAGIVGVPRGVDRSVMPYQEEPRDVPVQFTVDVTSESAARSFVPIVVTASTAGRAEARATYERVVRRVTDLYGETTTHYARLLNGTARVSTPDARLDRAYDWARIGMDKGLATNPALGTGLVAGFRTSGNSERPGFAWFFGRDALWTVLAMNATGNVEDSRTALEFLAKHQREDGKIPHEISQSATLVRWFTDYPYAWASADATPLYVIAHADLFRTSGDRAFLTRHWPSIKKAYEFSVATDTDKNGLIENTNVGHGWVEGGALYPPHEEIYLQGLWIEASRSLIELATEMGDTATTTAAREAADRTRDAVERTFWLADRSHYAFATTRARTDRAIAEPGPERERRQRRLDELTDRDRRPEPLRDLLDEHTVLPAVPMWWQTLDATRADRALDEMGSAALATDWGHRLLSDRSLLYDPLSYHYGSVWPLFTGWASVAAYRYGRPHVGYQALMANALLTESGALGYVTELLSGDRHAPFGRSSHHQIWSEAMVVSPLIRGLLGVEPRQGGRELRIAPQLPADWNGATARGVMAGGTRLDVEVARVPGAVTIKVSPGGGENPGPLPTLALAPALPLDAIVDRVVINGRSTRHRTTRMGDVQFVDVAVPESSDAVTAEFRYRGGTEVYAHTTAPAMGARSEGLRILRSRADGTRLQLLLEGLAGRTYELSLRSSRRIRSLQGLTRATDPGVQRPSPGTAADPVLRVTFPDAGTGYVRREVTVELEPIGR